MLEVRAGVKTYLFLGSLFLFGAFTVIFSERMSKDRETCFRWTCVFERLESGERQLMLIAIGLLFIVISLLFLLRVVSSPVLMRLQEDGVYCGVDGLIKWSDIASAKVNRSGLVLNLRSPRKVTVLLGYRKDRERCGVAFFFAYACLDGRRHAGSTSAAVRQWLSSSPIWKRVS